jgi:hypothetical protein
MRKRAILRLPLVSPCQYRVRGSLMPLAVAFMSAWFTAILGSVSIASAASGRNQTADILGYSPLP